MDVASFDSLEEMGDKLEELKVRRNDLNRSDDWLEDIERVVRYGLNGLDEQGFADPVYLVRSAAVSISEETFVDGDINREFGIGVPIDEVFEDLPQSIEEADEMLSDHPTEKELRSFVEQTESFSNQLEIKKYKKIINYAGTFGSVSREDVRNLVVWQDTVSGFLADEVKNLGLFTVNMKNTGSTELLKTFYSNNRLRLPDPPEEFIESFTEYVLHTYEGIIETSEENREIERFAQEIVDSNSSETIHTSSKKVDWNGFGEKYGSTPSEDMREFYEAALEYHDEDVKIQPELLTKVIADMNGYSVEYDACEKELADNLGSLKKAVGSTDMLDYKLPVMGKQREIQRITETIEKLHPFYEKETQVVVR